MIKLTFGYARYALASLALIAFGVSYNGRTSKAILLLLRPNRRVGRTGAQMALSYVRYVSASLALVALGIAHN
jgi:hypothetical protein